MVIEGMLALTGQHFIMDFNEREGTLPGFVEGFGNVARDEHRHVAFGSVFLREKAREDERYKEAIQRTLEESLPVAEGVLAPPWADGRRGLRSLRLLARGNPRVRRHLPDAAAEGHRARLSGGLCTCAVQKAPSPLRRASPSALPGRRRRFFDAGAASSAGGGVVAGGAVAGVGSAGGAGGGGPLTVTTTVPVPRCGRRRRPASRASPG